MVFVHPDSSWGRVVAELSLDTSQGNAVDGRLRMQAVRRQRARAAVRDEIVDVADQATV